MAKVRRDQLLRRTARRFSTFSRRSNSTPACLCLRHGGMVLRVTQGARLDDRSCGRDCRSDRLARKATHLGGDDPTALCTGGYALAIGAREFEDAERFIDRALAINPNLAQGWRLSAWLRVWTGEPDLVLEHMAHAVRLSPLDPQTFATYGAMAYAHFLAGRYDMATACAEKAFLDNPTYMVGICVSAASHALAGRPEPRGPPWLRALECNPELCASNLEGCRTISPIGGPCEARRGSAMRAFPIDLAIGRNRVQSQRRHRILTQIWACRPRVRLAGYLGNADLHAELSVRRKQRPRFCMIALP